MPTNLGPAQQSPRLGVDAYSFRSQGWSAFQILDYCRRWGIEVVHFSETRLLGGTEQEHLTSVKDHGAKLGLDVEIGMLSCCPSSRLFDATKGSAEEQLARMIDAAKTIGSPIVRAVVGNAADRRGPVPIERHIENAVEALRLVRSRALDAGVKIAIENHSGDMQARELKELIDAAGADFVGACLDSGNPLITLEDPHLSLEILAPYVLTSHVRDSAVWLTEQGAAAAWVRMGEGTVDIDRFVSDYLRLCPGKALSLEIIVSPAPRSLPYREPLFWDGYRQVVAWQFERFLELAEKGKPAEFSALRQGETQGERELSDFEASLKYTLNLLGRQVPAETSQTWEA